MKRVNNSLQDSLTENRMSDLCLLSEERDLQKKQDIDKIIDVFREKKRLGE